jgi:hypothetical protein
MVRRLIRTAVLAAALAAIPASSAQAALIETDPCDDAALSQAFSRWGDNALYKLAPAGDFEQGLDGVTLKGSARLVADNEPWNVTGGPGDRALELRAGASATLPATCVNAGNPTFRFFSRSSGGLLGLLPLLKVDVLYRDGALRIIPVPAGTALPSRGWQPSLHQLTLSVVGSTLAGGEAPVAIRLTAVTGTWTIDDVLVDPYRRS